MRESSFFTPRRDRREDAALLAGRIVEFVRLAREDRFRVGVQEAADALRVADCLDVTDAEQLRWGLRSLLCSNAADWARFDPLFDRYWRRPGRSAVEVRTSGQLDRGAGLDAGASGGPAPRAGARPARDDPQDRHGAGASPHEAITRSDFRLTELNRDTRPLEQWIEELAKRMRKRLLRRHHARSRGRRIHLRRTVRGSLRYGGLPLELTFQQRRRELPRLVLITDVSRSMSAYSYFFLRFARGLIDGFRDTEAFVFHTRLTHVTDALRQRDSHRLKDKLAWIAAGWGGGTRIGESLQAFNREYARRLVDSRTFVLIVSDGYDTGAPELLGEELRSLGQRARRIVWLNPLLGRAGYEPTAAAMQAALPHLDLFAPAHNLESLMQLERVLATL